MEALTQACRVREGCLQEGDISGRKRRGGGRQFSRGASLEEASKSPTPGAQAQMPQEPSGLCPFLSGAVPWELSVCTRASPSAVRFTGTSPNHVRGSGPPPARPPGCSHHQLTLQTHM